MAKSKKFIKGAKRYNPGELAPLIRRRRQDMGYPLFKKKVCKFRYRIDKNAVWYRNKKCAWRWCREKDITQLTVDHIVPISVAYYLNWSVKQTRSYGNIQLLCAKHHAVKDALVLVLRKEAYNLTVGPGRPPNIPHSYE